MRLGFTGSRYLSEEHHTFVDLCLSTYLDASEYTTGGAVGIDLYVLRALAPKLPDAHHRLIIAGANVYNENHPVHQWKHLADEVIGCAPDTDYRFRNDAILDYSDRLVAFPLHPEENSPRSGTWMTIRMARKRGIPVDIHLLAPTPIRPAA